MVQIITWLQLQFALGCFLAESILLELSVKKVTCMPGGRGQAFKVKMDIFLASVLTVALNCCFLSHLGTRRIRSVPNWLYMICFENTARLKAHIYLRFKQPKSPKIIHIIQFCPRSHVSISSIPASICKRKNFNLRVNFRKITNRVETKWTVNTNHEVVQWNVIIVNKPILFLQEPI